MPNVMRRSPNIFARSACPMMLIFSFSSRAFKFVPTGSLSSKCNGRMATFCIVILRSIYAIRPHWRHCEQNGSHLFATSKPLRWRTRSEEHTSELQSHHDLVCRLLLEKKK